VYTPKSILDIGCGNGSLVKYLTEYGFNVVGIDPSENGIKNARAILPRNKFYCMGIYDDPKIIEENDFEVVVSTEVIEHLFYPRELVRFAKKKLKKDGILLLSTPYHGYIKNLILSLTNQWDRHHTPLWDGGHIKFWSKNTLSHLLIEEGFEVLQFVGCGRIPLVWKSMLLVGKLM
jgi:2-polyprenyl-3-methyl-5-hydroxy-6-metoxy-1,4-benzoquinol methylase